ncbi:hypothetical protein BE20_06175 [Sorangium cellulosum]|nr:hypothetical protein BE20_06175 [Sorangium cellulosum]
MRNRAAGSTAATLANHASKPGGSTTRCAIARCTGGSFGPWTTTSANAITSPALSASGLQYGVPTSSVYAINPSA